MDLLCFIFLSRYFTENKVTDWKKFIKALARFLFSAVVAALISGILVVPTYFAIKNTGTQIYLSNPINTFNFNLFLSKFLQVHMKQFPMVNPIYI